MNAQAKADAKAVLERLHLAMNEHDVEAFLSCFDPDYLSVSSFPDDTILETDSMPGEWMHLFAGMKDFHAELLRYEIDGDSVWAEWLWQGSRPDGSAFRETAVTVFGAPNGLITWAGCIWRTPKKRRLIHGVVQQIARGKPSAE